MLGSLLAEVRGTSLTLVIINSVKHNIVVGEENCPDLFNMPDIFVNHPVNISFGNSMTAYLYDGCVCYLK